MILLAPFIAVLLLCSIPTSAQTYDFSALDRTLEDSLAILGGTGTQDYGGVCLMIWKDGKVIYERSLALPGETMSSRRMMPIASASKWISGAVIMALVDQGVMRLDDSVAMYIPTARGDMRRMTLRQLFSFTSGLRSNLGPITPCVEDIKTGLSLASCVDSILAGELTTAPGSTLNYGSEGMHVAGRMAEVASGLNLRSGTCWDTLFARTIQRPLGWTTTAWDIPGIYDTDNPRIDGGVFSNAEEYLRLLVMLLNGGFYKGKRVLSEAMVDTMLADQTRGARIGYTPYLAWESLFPGIRTTRYGIGVWRERIDSATDVLLEGASQGKFGFSPWIDFERRYCAVLAVKSNSVTSIYPTYMKLKTQIRAALDGVTSVDDQQADDGIWTLEGTYDVLGRRCSDDATGPVFRVERNGARVRTRALWNPAGAGH